MVQSSIASAVERVGERKAAERQRALRQEAERLEAARGGPAGVGARDDGRPPPPPPLDAPGGPAAARPAKLVGLGGLTLPAAGDAAEAQVDRDLFEAAQKGNVAAVRAALELGSAPDGFRTDFGTTALMAAASGGHLEATLELLAWSAQPNLKNKFGETALDIATSKGHMQLAKHLPGGSHNFTKINLKEAACVHCGRVVGKGRAGLWCVACGSCRACAMLKSARRAAASQVAEAAEGRRDEPQGFGTSPEEQGASR